MKTKQQIALSRLALFTLLCHFSLGYSAPFQQDAVHGPFVSKEATPLSSEEVKSLPIAREGSIQKNNRPRQNPLQNKEDQVPRETLSPSKIPVDPLIQPIDQGDPAPKASPPLLLNFDGTSNPTGCGGCTPPDTVGDVGPNHYVQMVNATKVTIYNKSGVLLSGPFDLSTLWPASVTSTCDDPDFGDPVVLYDPIAKRWLFSQFAASNHMCIAISKTADPTGAFWLYEFAVGEFPDYFKFGVWPDAYYMSANESSYTAYAFDRAKMLNGQAATFQKFTGGTNLYLPSDLDGIRQPPAGAPNYFYTFKDNSFHGGTDRLEVYAFHVDWTVPANSTFSLQNTINIAPFTYTVCGFFNFNCIRQLGTTQRFDALSEWPMFRFPYRNYGTYQALAGTFTVGGGLGEVGAAPRWFELRNTGSGWTLFQQGTFDPGDGKDRMMSSLAMDGVGNIALGYSVSNSTMHPAIGYTVHRIGDALGTMQAEAIMIAGGGSQTGSNRWGDYSAMSIDPADDFSFWYTNEYYATNSANLWKTRIGKFKIVTNALQQSVGINDGWVLESSENSNVGGSLDVVASVFKLGDDAQNRQYKAILHFNTGALPDNAVVTRVTLKIKKQGLTGVDPFTSLQNINVDIRKGSFTNNITLQNQDFQSVASKNSVGVIKNTPVNNLYSTTLDSSAFQFVNLKGSTQFRLSFNIDDNNNTSEDALSFFSGDAASVSDRPQLTVSYYIP